jgi:hypothetical protein
VLLDSERKEFLSLRNFTNSSDKERFIVIDCIEEIPAVDNQHQKGEME